jgi:hypothetical protein
MTRVAVLLSILEGPERYGASVATSRLYAQASAEIMHGHLAHAAYRPSNLDDIREV